MKQRLKNKRKIIAISPFHELSTKYYWKNGFFMIKALKIISETKLKLQIKNMFEFWKNLGYITKAQKKQKS